MPKFQKGNNANPNGRPKGSTLNVKKFRYDVAKICEEMGFDPFVELINLAKKTKSDKVRCDALTELAGYIAPKLKNVELSSEKENLFNIVLKL